MQLEKEFKLMISGLSKQVHDLLGEHISNIETELLPHIDNDTDMNVQYRAAEVIGKLAGGDYEIEEEGGRVKVKVNNYVYITLDAGKWNKAVDNLASRLSDKAKDLKIEKLEAQLKESYKRYC